MRMGFWLFSSSKVTPIEPRVTFPLLTSWLYTEMAVVEGNAKPTPSKPLLPVYIAVFMPITSPAMFTSGPPELPGLMAASVWMKRWN